MKQVCLSFALFASIGMNAFEASSTITHSCEIRAAVETPELDNELISVSVNGVDCTSSNSSVTIYTDQVFQFTVTYKNTGTATWGQHLTKSGERGASLRAPNSHPYRIPTCRV